MSAGADHYDTLGVARNATAAEIKRAYFKLVRVHSPENDPDGFRSISDAYTVLADPEARRAYDTEAPIPPELRLILARAVELLDEDRDQAAAEARRAVSAGNTPVPVRFAAARILLKTGNAAEALALARQVVREAPQVVDHQALLGAALHEIGEGEAAIEALERAVALGPWHIGACLLLIDCLRRWRGDEAALVVAERVLAAERFEPLEALPIQLRRFYALAAMRRFGEMERVVAEVAAGTPAGDDEAARHVARQWTGLGELAAKSSAAAAAEIAFRAAHALAPHPQIRAELSRLEAIAAFERMCVAAATDETLAEWVRAYLRRHLGMTPSQADGLRDAADLTRAIRRNRARIDAEWAAFETAYPAVAERLRADWSALRCNTAPPPPEAPRPTRTAPLVFAGAIALIIMTSLVISLLLQPDSLQPGMERGPRPATNSGAPMSDPARDELIARTQVSSRRRLGRRLVNSRASTPAEAVLSDLEASMLRGSTDAMIREDILSLWLPQAERDPTIARLLALRDALRAAAAPK